MKGKKWLWGFAALPVVCLPLIAQETRPESPAPTQAPTQAAVKPPADSTPAQDTPEPASKEQPEPADEHISADNNLSFPVDI